MKRLISLLLCLFLGIAAVGCTPVPKDPPPMTYEEQKDLYCDVIERYVSLLTAKQNGEALSMLSTEGMSQRERDIEEALYGIVEWASVVTRLGYGFKDMDGNGTPELLLLTRHSVRAVLTLSQKSPLLLEAAYGEEKFIQLAEGDRFFIERRKESDNPWEMVFCTARVDGEKMVYENEYGQLYDRELMETEGFFQTVAGERVPIDADTFRELHREAAKADLLGYATTLKWISPYICLPLKEPVTDEGRPTADFSSYAAIRDTCKKIAERVDDFQISKWQGDTYDELFVCPDDRSFEYYIRLLPATKCGSSYTGYDEIDLNGDGQDELVLMGEDYRIKAIFTQRNGVPVLLDAFLTETCWLDDEGLIHVDDYQAEELSYSVYELTDSGEYRMRYSILATLNGDRYLTKDGKTERISFERSLEIYYGEYCRYSEPFEPNEQTRNVTRLTYTPLCDGGEDLARAAVGKRFEKTASLQKTVPDKELASCRTDVVVEELTETQGRVMLYYAFSFCYPDPDRDNYLLNDTTESTLELTATPENGALVFDEKGVKGRIEFGHEYLWVIFEESTDPRFFVGNHLHKLAAPRE